MGAIVVEALLLPAELMATSDARKQYDMGNVLVTAGLRMRHAKRTRQAVD